MRLLPRSLYGRLLALSFVLTLAALGVAGVAISSVLERFVTATTDQRLADRLVALGAAVRADGSLDAGYAARLAARIAPDEPWRIDTAGGSTGSRRADGALAVQFDDDPRYRHRHGPPDPPSPGPAGRPDPLAGARPFDAELTGGDAVHGLLAQITTPAGPATLVAAVPRRVIDRPILAALVPLSLSLLLLGGALAAATLIQLRLGLRPLRQLQAAVATIRRGAARTLPEDQPDELRPLAVELNALVADNAAALAAARTGSANLAHALKTPLAALTLELGVAGRDPDGRLAALAARIDATLRHHLGRARAGAGDRRATTALEPVLRDLAGTIERIHGARGVRIAVTAADGIAAAIDPTDLAELVGNLLDNAARSAAAAVRVLAEPAERGMVRIAVLDDGPGIPAADRERATAPGVRLDEQRDGYGLGLAIARELAGLYGGSLTLDEAPGGGLAAVVLLLAAT